MTLLSPPLQRGLGTAPGCPLHPPGSTSSPTAAVPLSLELGMGSLTRPATPLHPGPTCGEAATLLHPLAWPRCSLILLLLISPTLPAGSSPAEGA